MDSDLSIVQEILRNREAGAARLVAECRDSLYAAALSLCGDPAHAEDLVFRTFERVLDRVATCRDESAFQAWMKAIMRNEWLMSIRGATTSNTFSAGAPSEVEGFAEPGDGANAVAAEVDASLLRDAIEELPDAMREAVVLRYFLGLPIAKAAKILAVPVGTVNSRLHYARAILAAKLGAAAKKPGGKALLVALALAALTAVGAAGVAAVRAVATPPNAECGMQNAELPNAIVPAADETPTANVEPPATNDTTTYDATMQRANDATMQLTNEPTPPLPHSPTPPLSPTTGDTMNTTNAVRTFAAATLAVATGIASADTPAPAGDSNVRNVRIANFDEDLATVYVNGEPATNGAAFSVNDGDTVTVELRDFRSDWYFAYAPASQTDRTLAFESWEGLPAGANATANPATFTANADLTITPNIDCKGHVWTAYGTTVISNATFRMSASAFNPAKRSLQLGTCNAYYAGDKVMDFAMRVDYFGTNYTITAIGNSPVNGHGAVEMRVPRRLASIGTLVSSGTTLTNIVGLSETALSTIPGLAFDQAPLHGPIMNYIPEGVTSVGHYAYRRGGGQTQYMLHGPLVLPHVTSFGVESFKGCAYVTELCATSPALTTLSSGAFLGCPRLMNVTLASPILSSVDVQAFTAITNLTYLSAPPASQAPLDNVVATVAASDGGKALTMRVPLGTPGWWDLVSEPTAAEVAAGLPEGCYGVYVTGTGDRKGWMIATDDVGASLVVTDMSKAGNTGYEIHAGLAAGDEIPLSSEDFTSCDLQHFNRATGVWETFETKSGSSFTYTHDGQLTRARWKMNGHALNLSSDCYGGTFAVSGAQPIFGDNVYAPNAILTVTAVGRAEHPTSHFAEWTSGVAGAATNSATITLTMDSDKTLAAAFAPDEWYYDPSTRKITDGEWTSASAVTLDATAKTVKSGAFASPAGHYSLWLDLSLPVLVETDPASTYHVTELTFADDGLIRKLRLGTRFKSFATSAFRYTTVLERLDGMGSSSMTATPYYFFMLADSCPLHFQTYEANDFLPETLVTLNEAWYAGGPYLVGTLRLPNLTSYRTDWAFANRTAGVTNLYLTCEALASFPYKLFHGMNLQELTIGSTNLAAAVSDSFSGAANTLERLNFLAHAPAAAALNNILVSYSSRTTTSSMPLEIHCSKRAPGWRALKAEVDKSSDEWLARPQGTWGIYQTAAGKRFYLVQRDSVHDENLHTMIILR